MYTPGPPTPGQDPSTPHIANGSVMFSAPSSPYPTPARYHLSVPPSPAPSFSWVDRTSTPFTGQSPAPLPPLDYDGGDDANYVDPTTLELIYLPETDMEYCPSEPAVPPSGRRCYQDEEDRYRANIAALEFKYGPEHEAVLKEYFNLATILREQGRYKSAELAFRGVMNGRAEGFGR